MSTYLIRGFVAFALVLISGEILVRLFIGGPSPQVYDTEIGYSYLPHGELFQAKEGYARFRFNALGLNDEEVVAKNGRCRVLAVGDSYTTALQVPRDRNFTSVAERLDPHLDVVNAGRDGLFLGDVHKVVRRLAPTTEADLVVYVLSEGDVEDDTQLPDFKIVVDPSNNRIIDAVMDVEAKEGFKEVFGPILHESALATRLSAQLQPSASSAVQMFATIRGWVGRLGGETPNRSVPAVARPSTEDVLTFVFSRLASEKPTALLYVNALHYFPKRRAEVASTSMNAEAIARRAAQRAGLLFMDTGEQLIASFKETGQAPFGFDNGIRPGGHLNASGHQAVARAFVELVNEAKATLPLECGKP